MTTRNCIYAEIQNEDLKKIYKCSCVKTNILLKYPFSNFVALFLLSTSIKMDKMTFQKAATGKKKKKKTNTAIHSFK